MCSSDLAALRESLSSRVLSGSARTRPSPLCASGIGRDDGYIRNMEVVANIVDHRGFCIELFRRVS